MGRFWNAVKQGAKAASKASGPGEFEVAGKPVTCSHCGGTTFIEGQAQLNTAGMTLMGLDWANTSASTLVCCECGCVRWFLADVVRR